MNTIEFKRAFPHAIHIEPTCNGQILVSVGCAKMTYENTTDGRTDMLEDILAYIRDPAAVEEAYNKIPYSGWQDPAGVAPLTVAPEVNSHIDSGGDCEQG